MVGMRRERKEEKSNNKNSYRDFYGLHCPALMKGGEKIRAGGDIKTGEG